jgi:hypothetical protein
MKIEKVHYVNISHAACSSIPLTSKFNPEMAENACLMEFNLREANLKLESPPGSELVSHQTLSEAFREFF